MQLAVRASNKPHQATAGPRTNNFSFLVASQMVQPLDGARKPAHATGLTRAFCNKQMQHIRCWYPNAAHILPIGANKLITRVRLIKVISNGPSPAINLDTHPHHVAVYWLRHFIINQIIAFKNFKRKWSLATAKWLTHQSYKYFS